jgi:hypothetical protein
MTTINQHGEKAIYRKGIEKAASQKTTSRRHHGKVSSTLQTVYTDAFYSYAYGSSEEWVL